MCSSLYFNNPLAAVFSILVFPATFLKKTSTNKKWNKGSQVYTRLIVYSHQELKIENEHPAGSMTAFPLFTRVWPQEQSPAVSHTSASPRLIWRHTALNVTSRLLLGVWMCVVHYVSQGREISLRLFWFSQLSGATVITWRMCKHANTSRQT